MDPQILLRRLLQEPLLPSHTKTGSFACDISSEATFFITYTKLTFYEELGRGGYGVVFRGEYQHAPVAIKQLLLGRLTEDSYREFTAETAIWKKLHHPNIVQLYGISVDNPGHCSMVMELMPQGSLYSVLHNGKSLPWMLRFRIARDIAIGLECLHDQDIVHRDLKSLNVLLAGDMTAKLTDFGLAKVRTATASTTTGADQSAGTTRWIAPELLEWEAQPTKASDIYSCGMVFWEIASREIPYKNALNNAVVVSWIEKGKQETMPKDTPESYARLIRGCWEKDVKKRPIAAQLAEELKKITQAEADAAVLTSAPLYQGNLNSQV